MHDKIILETQRLILREISVEDAEFILILLNTPQYLKFIGDKNVRTIEEAEEYVKQGPIKSYRENGFGLWLILIKDQQMPIGICGLIKRDILDDVDIGFALLPEYLGLGYGYEIATATLKHGNEVLGLEQIVAIADINNIASMKLLNKIGLRFEKVLKWPENDQVMFFAQSSCTRDKAEIDNLTTAFFDLFTNKDGREPRVRELAQLFIQGGIIVNNSEDPPVVYDLKTFMASREKLLTDGTISMFSEREIFNKTEVLEKIAQRFCFYEKSGKLNGDCFEKKGMKLIQFIKVDAAWKISSLSWTDLD
ncbi:GNAT family N-acetyltransferase [Fulvivirgaceae bacterium BMA12]|uniref:GNAT family N-acetyltransferase n=1 Tax=Agaribacillus aureus TaxID=3051825 RepID=A0ABT8LFV4_9BACT|nr:GNAT family N-acetyltransferase [Fulvivirgaceae bacterium BMA12]